MAKETIESPASPQRTQDQDRMTSAWACVQDVKNDDKVREKYKKLVRSAPADLQTNGLGQAISFWRAKTKEGNEHDLLYGHLSAWLMEKKPKLKKDKAPKVELHEWIVQSSLSTAQYMRATREALAYLVWLKRFAEAEIEDKKKSDDKADVAEQVS